MKKILAALVVLFFAGPSHAETTSLTAPNGAQLFKTLGCTSPDACYQEARQTCRGNYQVVDSDRHEGGLFGDSGARSLGGVRTYYMLTYACGRSDGRLALFPFRGGHWVPPRYHSNDCYNYGYGYISCSGVY